MEGPYDDYDSTRLILREQLAIDRTTLANERTLLAYIRTALALLAAGVSFVQFFKTLTFEILGYFSVLSGIVLLTIGTRRFFQLRRAINGTKYRQSKD
jgi:putative membrane protein